MIRLIEPHEIPNLKCKCKLCGKFISIKNHDNFHLDFTPDTEFTTESFDYYHKDCWNKLKNIK